MTMMAKGYSGVVTLEGDALTIEHRGPTRLTKKNQHLSVGDVSEVEFQASRLGGTGYLRFRSTGPWKPGRRAAAQDDLAIFFRKPNNAEFQAVADAVTHYIEERPPQQLPEVAAAPREIDISLPATFEHVSLIEPRSTEGRWKGGSSGVSVPVPGLDGVRFRVGGSAGEYVRGDEKLTVIDTDGRFLIDHRRAAFMGTKQTREWSYANLLRIMHAENMPATILNVSNRQRASGILYSEEVAPILREALERAAFGGGQAATSDTDEPPESETRIAQLERLAALRASGALTEEEFMREKARLIE